MSLTAEMSAFIVENAELVDQAYSILDEADEILLENMVKFTKKIIDEDGIFDIVPEGMDLFFGRSKWGKNEKDEPLLSFSLDCQGENTDKQWLLVLTGKATGAMAGFFCWYDWGSKGITKKVWKNFLQDFFLNHDTLHERGFILNDTGTAIIKPFHLDSHCLKDNFLLPDICFEPLSDAIEIIISQIKIFDQLAKQAAKLGKHEK